MACRSTSTDPERAGDPSADIGACATWRRFLPAAPTPFLLAWALSLCAVLAPARGTRAHEQARPTTRELVRLVGFFGEAPAGTRVERTLALTVQGKELTLRATEWLVITLASETGASAAGGEPDRLTLQGTREQLARLAAARPEQRVSILAERRPGRDEAFVVALDLCPGD